MFIARKLLKAPNYQRWNDFNWSDFIEREHLVKTFNNRHLPVLRGEKTLSSKYLKDPESWTSVTPTSDSSKKKRTVDVVKKSVKRTLMWDFSSEKWVPNEMGSQVPNEQVTPSNSTPARKKKKKMARKSSEKKKSGTPSSVRRSPRKKK